MTADFIVLSHAHADHLGDTEAIAARTGARVIAMNELALYLGAKGLAVDALQIGGGMDFPFGRVKLVPALHSSSFEGAYMGNEAGILLRDNEGTVLYHAGDTGLFSDMRLIGRAGLDVALLPIGDKYTMGPDDALTAVELLETAPRDPHALQHVPPHRPGCGSMETRGRGAHRHEGPGDAAGWNVRGARVGAVPPGVPGRAPRHDSAHPTAIRTA